MPPQSALAQEKGERARLLVALRESHASAQQLQQQGGAGDRLRQEALDAHAAAAAARSAAERAEERAAAWRDEAETLRGRLAALDKVRVKGRGGGGGCSSVWGVLS